MLNKASLFAALALGSTIQTGPQLGDFSNPYSVRHVDNNTPLHLLGRKNKTGKSKSKLKSIKRIKDKISKTSHKINRKK